MADNSDEVIVSVVTSVAPLSKALSYRVPESFRGPTSIGSRVAVPLHGRTVTGWIVGEEANDQLEAQQLKSLTRSQGYGPPESLVDLCRFAAWRWAGSLAHFLSAASPATIVASLPDAPKQVMVEVPDSALGRCFGALQPGDIVLGELGPAHDPFDVVLGAVAACAHDDRGGSLLVMVPSKGYAKRLSGRLARRGVRCVEVNDAWDAARSGWPVVVGTRNVAFAPVPRVAGAVVLDAEDPALISSAAPTVSGLEVLAERVRRDQGRMVALSPVPHARLLDGRVPIKVAEPPEREGWATPIIVNRQGGDPRLGWISQELVAAARDALEHQHSGVAGVCVINRKGRAKLLVCKRCDTVARCANCEAAVSLGDTLVCPRCGATQPSVCKSCGSMSFKQLRLGTQRLAEEFGALLGVPCGEVTAETKELDPKARFLVGTEAVLYRLRTTSLVGFVDIDHHLLASRASAEIDALRLLARASRLVGGRGAMQRGRVLVQTRLAEHRVFDALRKGDPTPVLNADRELRAQLQLPPFRAMAAISGAGQQELCAALEALGADVITMEDHAVVVGDNHEVLCTLLEQAGRPKARVRVALDPEEV